ncbi:MAG: site-specific integrase [Flavobacteriales bacterium]|jgi:integrase|nr:site-specific integrase [Flavobacteriales bacterium]
MARINLNLRTPRSRDESPINIVIRWNGQRLVYPSGERIQPRHWSVKAQRANRSLTGHSELNVRLDAITSNVQTAFRQFLNDNDQRDPSIGELRGRLDIAVGRNAAEGPQTLMAFIDGHIAKAIVRMEGGELSGTSRLSTYRTTRDHLLAFSRAKRYRLDFDTIDTAFYQRFVAYLTSDKGMAKNTVGKYIRTLKTFLNAAVDDNAATMPGYHSRRFKAPKEDDNAKAYLTAGELDELFQLDLSSEPRLDRARDLFIVGAWTGLRYSDWATIRPEHIQGDSIRIHTEKTDTVVTVPVNPRVRAILNKYGGALPRVLSNQKMNDYLREVAAMVPSLQQPFTISKTVAGVRRYVNKAKAEVITTHTARRSFATNAYRGDGYTEPIPTRSIMAITGHTKEQSFRIYIRLNADEHADILRASFTDAPTRLAVVA